MTEVTYFVALPFIAADDGVAAANHGGIQPDRRSRYRGLWRCPGHQEVRRSAGRSKYRVEEQASSSDFIPGFGAQSSQL